MSNSVIDFLINKGSGGDAVDAQAFSITKVLSTAALVLTPLTAVLVKALTDIKFTDGEVVVLIVAVLAFLAVVSAADVIARAMATAAASHSQVVPIAPVVDAVVGNSSVKIIGTRRDGGGGDFLVFNPADDTLSWRAEADVHNLQRQ